MTHPTPSFHEQFCIEVTPVPLVLTIFGASGDLARLKLFPALCRLFQRQLFHPKSQIFAFARTPNTTENFREYLRVEFKKNCSGDCAKCADLDAFLSRVHYVQGAYDSEEGYVRLRDAITDCEAEHAIGGNRLFYLSVPASVYAPIAQHLAHVGLTEEPPHSEIKRNVIIEKPFGYDGESARRLDAELTSYLKPSQIFRIDHYLGKETVQNLMMLRFANRIYEPLWNHHHIESVQITASETVGIGTRAGYYDDAGCVRDMFQNHLLQMAAFVGMEAPASFEAKTLNAARTAFLDSVTPPDPVSDWVRGQYAGYRVEKGVRPDSNTETFAACVFFSNAPRWKGVPFYLRSGKCMAQRETTITIQFKKMDTTLFAPIKGRDLPENRLQIYVQPSEGMVLSTLAKKPGPKLCIGALNLSYKYSDVYDEPPPEAYERLLLEAMLGDATLFTHADAVNAAWKILDPSLEFWKSNPEKVPPSVYDKGTDGPSASSTLLAQRQHAWIPRILNQGE